MNKLTITEDKKYNDTNQNYIYYNINITKDSQNNGVAEFSETRTIPILTKGDEYDVSICRFSIPSDNIPIFLWKEDMSVSITYTTSIFTQPLIYVSNRANDVAPYINKAIFQYSQFIDIINVALESAFLTFQSDPIYLTIPLIDRPTEPPILVYDPKTQLISLYTQPQYNVNNITPIYIYFNTTLFSYFPTFQNYGDEFNPILAHHFIVKNNGNNLVIVNGNPYLRTTEEWNGLFLWNDFQTILFETDHIPVNNELLGTQKNITRKILIDFEPISNLNDQSVLQFYPQSSLRFYNLISNVELRKIDMRVFWNTKDGRTYPLIINDNDFLTIKLIFKRKGKIVNNMDF